MNVPHSKLSEQEIKDICDLKHKSKEFVLQQGDLNYAIADMMFNWLEAQGVVATNLKSLHSYFLFCFYPNSVYHFNVKGLSNKWKFGMWISNPAPYLNNEEEYKDAIRAYYPDIQEGDDVWVHFFVKVDPIGEGVSQ